jgi:hypothetical protein
MGAQADVSSALRIGFVVVSPLVEFAVQVAAIANRNRQIIVPAIFACAAGASCPEITALLLGAACMRYLPPGGLCLFHDITAFGIFVKVCDYMYSLYLMYSNITILLFHQKGCCTHALPATKWFVLDAGCWMLDAPIRCFIISQRSPAQYNCIVRHRSARSVALLLHHISSLITL